MKELFEHAVKEYISSDTFDSKLLMQVSGLKISFILKSIMKSNKNLLFAGLKVSYDMSKPLGQRVISIEVLDFQDNAAKYRPLDPTKYYRCMASSFLADGSDGFDMVSKYKRNHKYV